MTDAAQMVEALLAGQPVDLDPATIFSVAVDRLVADGLNRHTAVTLMRSAQGRGDDLTAWSRQIVASRAEYRRRLEEGR